MTALKALGLIVAGVIVGLLFSVVKSDNLGGVYNQVSNRFLSGLYAGSSSQFRVDSSGNVTTSGTASVTGDVTVGQDLILSDNDFCINFYATSTATQNKMYASTTATIENVDGVIMFGYGSCLE